MTITEKIILTENQLKHVVEEHNQLGEKKQQLFTEFNRPLARL